MRDDRPGTIVVALLLAAVAVGCSSDEPDATPPTTGGAATTLPSGASTTLPVDASTTVTAPVTAESTVPPPTTGAPTSDVATTLPESPSVATTTTAVPSPVDPPEEDADVIALSDGFDDDEDEWDPSTWEVDVPGQAEATASDGAGVMRIDQRGTYEWVRAVATDSVHTDAGLLARIRPLVDSGTGTVFVGLHGDGEWQDATAYLPQSGVIVEYGFADVYLGEVTLIVVDGTETVRYGPVTGPVLADGESADIRFEVADGRARVMVWRTGDEAPTTWQLEIELESAGEGGVVQLAYRDGTGAAVAWDELTLYTLG